MHTKHEQGVEHGKQSYWKRSRKFAQSHIKARYKKTGSGGGEENSPAPQGLSHCSPVLVRPGGAPPPPPPLRLFPLPSPGGGGLQPSSLLLPTGHLSPLSPPSSRGPGPCGTQSGNEIEAVMEKHEKAQRMVSFGSM